MDETTLVKSYKSSRMFWMDEIGQGGQLLETLHHEKHLRCGIRGRFVFCGCWVTRKSGLNRLAGTWYSYAVTCVAKGAAQNPFSGAISSQRRSHHQ